MVLAAIVMTMNLILTTYLKRIDAIGVSLERMQAFLRVGIPNFNHVIVCAGHNQFAIILHTAHRCQVTDQCVKASTLHNVPDAQRCIT